MKKFYADRKSLVFLRFTTFVAIGCVIAVLNYGLYFAEQKFPKYFLKAKWNIPEIVIWIFIGLCIIAYVLFLVIILPLWYNTVSYTLYTDEIEAKYGLFSKTRQFMKLSAVQYTTKISFPLSKYSSFNFIFLNALGGKLCLMFLSDKDAESITKKIDNYIESRCGL